MEFGETKKKARLTTEEGGDSNDGEVDGDGDDDMVCIDIEEETVADLLKLLEPTDVVDQSQGVGYRFYNGGGDGGCFTVKFIDNPYSTSLVFQPSSSYITINGNEESCGSSFSDAASSVMASVDTAGICLSFGDCKGKVMTAECEGACDTSEDEAEARQWILDDVVGGDHVGEATTKGFDFDRDWDDDSLARFLGEDLPSDS